MTRARLTAFLTSCLFWFLPGLAAGIAASLLLTAADYHNMAELTGAVQRSGSIPEGLKHVDQKDREAGETFLNQYGYRPFSRLRIYLLPAAGTSLFLFEGIGLIVFLRKQQEENRLERRIDGLTEYLRAVNAGEANVLTRTEDHFSHLEDEIYKTVVKLKRSQESAVRDHEALSLRIADIAHQLKTPLTSMSLMAELLEDSQTGERKEYLERLQNQIVRLHKLVAGLLTLARLDSHVIVFDKTNFDAAQWIAESAEPLQALLKKKKITLTIEKAGHGKDPGVISGDRAWSQEALLNVLKNCVEHTPCKGTICVSYGQNPLSFDVVITDSGPGISKKDLPHLFERFYKGEGSAKDSAGIGLALARLVMEEQNGQLHAENTPDGHARFQMKFYR